MHHTFLASTAKLFFVFLFLVPLQHTLQRVFVREAGPYLVKREISKGVQAVYLLICLHSVGL